RVSAGAAGVIEWETIPRRSCGLQETGAPSLGEAQTAVEKENVRRYILRLRDRQSIGEVEQKSQEITDQVLHLHEYVRARGIACYVNKDTEVDTRVLIRTALGQGKRVLVPVVKKGDVELFFSEIKDVGREIVDVGLGFLAA